MRSEQRDSGWGRIAEAAVGGRFHEPCQRRRGATADGIALVRRQLREVVAEKAPVHVDQPEAAMVVLVAKLQQQDRRENRQHQARLPSGDEGPHRALVVGQRDLELRRQPQDADAVSKRDDVVQDRFQPCHHPTCRHGLIRLLHWRVASAAPSARCRVLALRPDPGRTAETATQASERRGPCAHDPDTRSGNEANMQIRHRRWPYRLVAAQSTQHENLGAAMPSCRLRAKVPAFSTQRVDLKLLWPRLISF